MKEDLRTVRVRDAPISDRKREHVAYALDGSQSSRSPGWDDVELLHCALPETNFDRVELQTEFLGHGLRAPLAVAAMTGGHADAYAINERLAAAAQAHGLAIGVGSQRAALCDKTLSHTYEVVRRTAPDAFVIANIGIAQLVPQSGNPPLGLSDVRRAVEMIDANALAVHLNFLEEVIQPEGDRCAEGCLRALERTISALEVPVIAKETGAGLSPAVLRQLVEIGIAAVDVGGRGGTSFARIEAQRAVNSGHQGRARLGAVFSEWGIPTAVSLLSAARFDVPVVATGGVRTGLDAAKALALGARAVGVGRPFLAAAVLSEEAVAETVEQFLDELRVALFLSGAVKPGDLIDVPHVILGETLEWVRQTGIRPTAA